MLPGQHWDGAGLRPARYRRKRWTCRSTCLAEIRLRLSESYGIEALKSTATRAVLILLPFAGGGILGGLGQHAVRY